MPNEGSPSAPPASKPDEPAKEPDLPVKKNWLEATINAKCGTKATIKSYKCSIIGEGKGFLSVCTKVKLEWEATSTDIDKLPKSVITKKPTMAKMEKMDLKEMQDFMTPEMLRTCHNNEVRAYQFFNKYPPPPIPMAKLYHAEVRTDDPESGLLVLEDLSDVAISLAFGQDATKEKLMTLAEHAASLQAYGLNHSDWTEYIHPMNVDSMKAMMSDTKAIMQRAKEAFPQMPYSAEELVTIVEKVTDGFDMFADPSVNGYTAVIALGDVQPNNILWKMNAEGKPSNDVEAFIDFQIAMVGYCVTDLSMTMITAMPAQMRRDSEDEIFGHYLEVLKEKSEKPVTLTMSEIKTVFRKFMAILATVHLPMFGQIYAMIGMDESHKVEDYKRFMAAIEDAQKE